MNAAPDLAVWLELLLLLGVGGVAIVGCATLLERWIQSAVWHRALWRTCLLGLTGLLLTELTGMTDGLWEALSRCSRPQQPAEAVLVKMPSTGAGRPFGIADKSRITVVKAEEARSQGIAEGDFFSASRTPYAARDSHQGDWWPGILWLLGTTVVSARIVVARVLLAVFRCRHQPSDDSVLADRVRSVARQLKISRRVHVLNAPSLLGPVAFGILRPTIALPAQFTDDFDDRKQEVMLAHELAHVAAHDPAWHLLADLVTAALWWHPAAWWARHRLRAASETAADEASLLIADGPAVLAACLVELGKRLIQPRPAGGLRMAGSGFRSSLGRRVERLIQLGGHAWQPPSRMRFVLAISVGAALLLAAAILSTAWARSQALFEGDLSMRTMQPSWRRSLAGMVLCAALAASTDTARSDDPPAQPADPAQGAPTAGGQKSKEAKTEAPRQRGGSRGRAELAQAKAREEETKAAMRIRVFRLSHRDPEEVQQILQGLLEVASAHPGAMGMVGLPGGPGGMVGGVGGRGGMMGAMGPGGMMPGGGVPMGGGFAGFGSGPGSWRLAVDQRTRSLIVRGTERDLQTVADLVAVLDLPAGKPIPKVKNLRAYQLRHANAEELTQVLQLLELDVRIVPLPKANLLILAGAEEAMKEIGSVIEELDVEQKAPAKPE